MYEIVTGPLAWLSFLIFFTGIFIRVVCYIFGLDWKLDRVTYTVNTSYGIKGAIKSILFWIIPFGSRSWRIKPGYTTVIFTFHIGLLMTPLFLMGHNILLQERWGISLITLPEKIADIMTIAVLVSALLILLRRIALPEVRVLTTANDILLLVITVAPFITGFVARMQLFDYNFWLIVHILSGEALLIAIPFTRLSHVVLFFMSRAQIGMDYGIKRGGMKGSGIVW